MEPNKQQIQDQSRKSASPPLRNVHNDQRNHRPTSSPGSPGGVGFKQLKQSILKAESRVETNIKTSQQKHRQISYSINNLHDVGTSDKALDLYTCMKMDIRALLGYHVELILKSMERWRRKNALENQELAPQFNEEKKIRRYIRDFEENYSAEKAFDFNKLLNVAREKEEVLCQLIKELFEFIGDDFVVTEDKINKVSTSKGLCSMLDLFATVESLGLHIKRDDMSLTEKEMALQLAYKASELRDTKTELTAKTQEIVLLKTRIHLMSSEGGRIQLISKQHESIQDLEHRISDFESQIKLLQYQNTVLTQDKATLQDQLALCKSQLKNAQLSYEIDIKKLQPVVESFIQQGQVDHRQLQSLRNDFGISCLKILQSEKAKIDAIEEMEAAKSNQRTTAAELRFQLEVVKKLEEEIQRQSRLKNVAVASKSRGDVLIKELELKLQNSEESNKQLTSLADSQRGEISDIESYVEQLHNIVKQAEAKANEMTEKWNIKKVEFAAQEVVISQLKGQLEASSTKIWEEKVKKLEDDVKQFKSQLTNATRRINDLNMEIEVLNGLTVNPS